MESNSNMGGTQIKDSPVLPQLTRSTATNATQAHNEGNLNISGNASGAYECTNGERSAVAHHSLSDASSHASQAAAAAAAAAALHPNGISCSGGLIETWSLFDLRLNAVGQDEERMLAATSRGPLIQVESAAIRQRLREDASVYVLAAMANYLQDRHVLRITYSPKYCDEAFEYRVVTLPLDHPYLQLPPNVLRAFASGASAFHFLAAASASAGSLSFSGLGSVREGEDVFGRDEETRLQEGSGGGEASSSERRLRTRVSLALPSTLSNFPFSRGPAEIVSNQGLTRLAAASSAPNASSAPFSSSSSSSSSTFTPETEETEEAPLTTRAAVAAAVAEASRAAATAERAASAVPLSASVASLLSEKCIQLPEPTWRSLGIRMSRGWINIGNGIHEAHCLLFARPLQTDGVCGLAPSAAVQKAEALMKKRREIIKSFALSVGEQKARPRRQRRQKAASLLSLSLFPYDLPEALTANTKRAFPQSSLHPPVKKNCFETSSDSKERSFSSMGWRCLASFCDDFFAELASAKLRKRKSFCQLRPEKQSCWRDSGEARSSLPFCSSVERRIGRTLASLQPLLMGEEQRSLLELRGSLPLWCVPGVVIIHAKASTKPLARKAPRSLCGSKEDPFRTGNSTCKKMCESSAAAEEMCLSVMTALQQLPPALGGFDCYVLELRPLKSCELRAGQTPQDAECLTKLAGSEDQAEDGPLSFRRRATFDTEALNETLRAAYLAAQREAPAKAVPLNLALLLRLSRENNLLDANQLVGSSVVVLGNKESNTRKGTVAAVDEESGAALLNLKKGEGLAVARCVDVFWCLDT